MKKYLKNLARDAIDHIILAESVFHHKEKHAKQRVLILRKDGLGDCILFLPFLQVLREHYRDAEITLVFPDYCQSLAPLLRSMDTVVWFSHRKFARDFFYRRSFLLKLKRAGFDVAIYPVFTRETAGDRMMRIAGAAETIGFAQPGERLYNRPVQAPQHLALELERNAYLVKEITGREVSVTFPTIKVDDLPGSTAESLMARYRLNSRRFAIVFPGSGAPYKIWPRERFAQAIAHIASLDITPVICGSDKETALAEEIVSLLPAAARAETVVLSGQTDLPALAHLLSRSALYFGSDTGILHLAVAVGTPAVAIVGSGSISRFFPYGDPQKNRAVASQTHPPTGEWLGLEILKPGATHPSIEAVTLEAALREIDALARPAPHRA